MPANKEERRCTSCNKVIGYGPPPSSGGRCPWCKVVFAPDSRGPLRSEVAAGICPACDRLHGVRKEYGGIEIKCFSCQRPFLMPKAGSKESEAACDSFNTQGWLRFAVLAVYALSVAAIAYFSSEGSFAGSGLFLVAVVVCAAALEYLYCHCPACHRGYGLLSIAGSGQFKTKRGSCILEEEA